MQFLNRFRRITSRGNYIPEIDGLRFLAIAMVVIFHMQGFFSKKSALTYPGNANITGLLMRILGYWDKGVLLFFVISGFILALPFATHMLKGGKKVALKSFYVRRVTRLEPPYFITMISLFILLLITRIYTFSVLFPSLLASLTYSHNIIYGTPLIAVATWSLEVEIQFYLLAPLMTRVYKLSKLARRAVLVLSILSLPVIQHIVPVTVITLYSHLQYFLLGLLLADLYVCRDTAKGIVDNRYATLSGLISLGVILLIDQQANVANSWIFLVSIFYFYYMVLNNRFWKKAFSIPLIAIIGGMCYSIYLWHFAIISLAGRFIVRFHVTGNFLINLAVFCLLSIIPVLFFSTIFFYSIEKPCMSKDWHKRLLLKIPFYTR